MSRQLVRTCSVVHAQSAPPEEKLLVVMVGLPACGKSYISKKLVNYFNWLGFKAQVFNVGNRRREKVCTDQSAKFFSADNKECKEMRDQLAYEVLNDALNWLAKEGTLACYDATNTTNERRNAILMRCGRHLVKPSVVFVESICEAEEVIMANILQKISNSPDYKNMPREQALADIKARIEEYKRVYERITDDSLSYIKCINLQSKIVANNLVSTMTHRMCTFLMSIHIQSRPVYLIRPGHVQKIGVKSVFNTSEFVKSLNESSVILGPSIDDLAQELGFDNQEFTFPSQETAVCDLSTSGREFAKKLPAFFKNQGLHLDCLKIYTSPLTRAIQTVSYLGQRSQQWSCLNMLDTGVCHGKTVAQIQQEMPREYQEFLRNPFTYRMPGGESFQDCIKSLEPLAVDIERQRTPVVVVSHLSTLRLLYGYFKGLPFLEQIHANIPAHTVVRLVPAMYGWEETRYNLGPTTESD